jgi:O-antigen/teichoic acid export membrane protein
MFFVPVVNVRTLSVEEYGYYRQFWLLFDTLTPILILGFPRSLLYYFPRSERAREKSVYITQTVVFLFAVSVVAVIVYTVMGWMLGGGMGAMVRAFYWRLCIFTIFMMMSRHMDELFVAEKQVERQAFYYVITALVRSGVVIAVSWYARDVSAIIWGLAILSAVKAAFALIYTRIVYRPSLKSVSFSTIREQLSFALPLGMMAIATLLLSQTDKFIINRFMGREAFAIYSVGAFQLPFVAIIAGSVANVTFPIMARYQKDGQLAEFGALWKRAWLKTAVLFFPIFVFFMITAEQFIIILFTDTYAGAIPIFRIYLILFLNATTDYAGVLTAFKKQEYLFKILLIAFVAHVITSIALFLAWGRLGVPLSTVFWFFVVATLAVRKGGLLLGQSFWQTVPGRRLLARLVAAAVPGVILYFIYAQYHDYSVFRYMVAGVLYFTSYFALCWAFRFLTLDDIKSLFGKGLSETDSV